MSGLSRASVRECTQEPRTGGSKKQGICWPTNPTVSAWWPCMVYQKTAETLKDSRMPLQSRLAPSFHASRLNPVTPGPLAADVPLTTPPIPLDNERQPDYLVKNILNLCVQRWEFVVPHQVVGLRLWGTILDSSTQCSRPLDLPRIPSQAPRMIRPSPHR